MKSIVQEASSIAKAIERGLEKLGKPQDFSVKILEYPEKNFFGLTTKPAKIALYCDEKARKAHDPHPVVLAGGPVASHDKTEEAVRGKGRERRDHESPRSGRRPEGKASYEAKRRDTQHKTGPFRVTAPPAPTVEVVPDGDAGVVRQEISEEKVVNKRGGVEVRRREAAVPRWTPEVIQYVHEWLTKVLAELGKQVPFVIEQDNFHIKVIFEKPLFDDADHERRVLSSLSLLIVETCRYLFKLNLRDHRAILTHRSQ